METPRSVSSVQKRTQLELPRDVVAWKFPQENEFDQMWLDLEEPLKEHGYALWETTEMVCTLWAPEGRLPLSSGFSYVNPIRGIESRFAFLTLFNHGVSRAPCNATYT